MGKLHCFEEDESGGLVWDPVRKTMYTGRDYHSPHNGDIFLRRLPDAEAEEMRRDHDDARVGRDRLAETIDNLTAERNTLRENLEDARAALLREGIRAGRPADADRAEVERIADLLFVHGRFETKGGYSVPYSTAEAHDAAGRHVAERNRRRAESWEA